MRSAQRRFNKIEPSAAPQHCYLWVIETSRPIERDLKMPMMKTLRDRFAKRAAYNRTRDAIASLPVELAIEDLGISPSDADKIAKKAVYNR